MNREWLRSVAGINNQSMVMANEACELTDWQRLAGITYQQLLEAREDTINNSQGYKLWAIYEKKQDNIGVSDSLGLIKWMSANIGSKNIQWLVNVYINDPQFRLTMANEVMRLLVEYNGYVIRKGQQLVDANIGVYKTVDQLRNALLKAKGGLESVGFNEYCLRFYQRMTQAVEAGNARWIHKSGSLCIYTDVNVEGARAIRRAHPADVQLCTTYLDSDESYNGYKQCGIQLYILTVDNLYLLFIRTNDILVGQATEFADYKNDHLESCELIGNKLKAIGVVKLIKPFMMEIVDDVDLAISLYGVTRELLMKLINMRNASIILTITNPEPWVIRMLIDHYTIANQQFYRRLIGWDPNLDSFLKDQKLVSIKRGSIFPINIVEKLKDFAIHGIIHTRDELIEFIGALSEFLAELNWHGIINSVKNDEDWDLLNNIWMNYNVNPESIDDTLQVLMDNDRDDLIETLFELVPGSVVSADFNKFIDATDAEQWGDQFGWRALAQVIDPGKNFHIVYKLLTHEFISDRTNFHLLTECEGFYDHVLTD